MSPDASEDIAAISESVDERLTEIDAKLVAGDDLTEDEIRDYHRLLTMQTTIIAAESSDLTYDELADALESYATELRKIDE